VPDQQLTAGVAGRQGHHEGPDHRIVFLGVLVGEEELVRLIDQQGVKIGRQSGGARQSQLFFHRGEDLLQRGSGLAISSTLNAACASPRSVLGSWSRAAVAMALILPFGRYATTRFHP
jgi:hypothetical protein